MIQWVKKSAVEDAGERERAMERVKGNVNVHNVNSVERMWK